MDYVKIGKRIREARKAQNLTQEAALEKCDITSAYYGNIELVPKHQKVHHHNLQMYVLSNQYGVWGASAILYPGVLRKAAKKLGGDLLILSSSIHEVILVRHENMGEYDKIAEFVKEINQKEVLPEDVLSDSIYLYKQNNDRIDWIAV